LGPQSNGDRILRKIYRVVIRKIKKKMEIIKKGLKIDPKKVRKR